MIDDLKVSFSEGFTIITGETGAGKSILLGALSLVLGKRADLSVLRNLDEKCIVEAEFFIREYNLKSFFQQEDIDYEEVTLIRREILPSGKSRAFINDSPVNLETLSNLGKILMDIHSQNDTQQIVSQEFQFHLLDTLCQNQQNLSDYKNLLKEYKSELKKLKKLQEFQLNNQKEYDYNTFIFNELKEADLENESQEELEETYEQASNVEEIKETISQAREILSNDDFGIVNQMRELKITLSKLTDYGKSYEEIFERIENIFIEIDDLSQEIYNLSENVDFDPKELENIHNKLQQIYNLQKKHQVNSLKELLEIQYKLEENLLKVENIEQDIENQKIITKTSFEKVKKSAQKIRENRIKIIPMLTEKLQFLLNDLGMPNARFQIEILPIKEFLSNGNDQISFLFSANKGGNFGALKKVASGGELSRIMLSVKSLLAEKETLPTIIFDEIDTGVSGEIAHKMGDIMKHMSQRGQIFSITHLPQVASKGNTHFRVFKEDIAGKTTTQLKKLLPEERINEIAQMLGGKEITETAILHAKQLLKT